VIEVKEKYMWRFLSILAIVFLSIFVALPLYWTFTIAFRPNMDLFMHRIIPSRLTLENFKRVLFSTDWGGFESVPFFVPLFNSFLVAGVVTLMSLTVSIFAGYGLARLRIKWKNVFESFILFAYVFPPFIIIIALYSFLHKIHLYDSLFGLMLLHLIIVVPYSTWTLRGYFLTIPQDIEDAALVDGLSRIGTLFKIVLPSAAPGIASTAIFSFTLSWSELLFAMTVIDSYEKFTLPIALRTMVIGDFVNWGNLMAGVVISMLPPMIFYLVLQRYVISGLTAGAIK